MVIKIFDSLEKLSIRKHKASTQAKLVTSASSPRSLPLSIIGISLDELIETGVLPDSSAEIENQFKGIAATSVPPISQTLPQGVASTQQQLGGGR